MALFVVMSFSASFALISPADAEGASPDLPLAQDEDASEAPVEMMVGIWIINAYDFDYPSGRYVFDFFIYFLWSDPGISEVNWYIMNGYPSTSATKELVDRKEIDGLFVEIYRVRANLSYSLEAGNHPFEVVKLPIKVEVTSIDRPVQLLWSTQESGVDPSFKIVGWRMKGVEYDVEHRQYPYEIGSYQASMSVLIERELLVAIPQLVLPPIIFCIVSAFSYLLRMDDGSAFGLRFGLNTSMLISAVLFAVAVQNILPPTSTINFYTVFVIGVFIFLASNIVVTILGYVEFNYMDNPQVLRAINRYGVLASVMISLAVLGVAIYSMI